MFLGELVWNRIHLKNIENKAIFLPKTLPKVSFQFVDISGYNSFDNTRVKIGLTVPIQLKSYTYIEEGVWFQTLRIKT